MDTIESLDNDRPETLREQWLRPSSMLTAFVVVVGTLVLAWRLLRLPEPTDFRLTDLLSMFLALFAIGLSAAFYFRATRDSYTFFDRMYEFTKQSAETLGRIEAGFSEQLRTISAVSEHVRDRVDQLPDNPYETAALKQEEEKEKSDIIEDLMKRAKLSDAEMKTMRDELARREGEIAALTSQMAATAVRLDAQESTPRSQVVGHRAEPRPAHREFEEYVSDRFLDENSNRLPSRNVFASWMFKFLHDAPFAVDDSEGYGYTQDRELTTWGWNRFRRVLPARRRLRTDDDPQA